MISWLKLALRNLFRNRRRSLFTILAIGLGFAAVNTLGGFTAYIFTSLKDSYIYAQGNGHLSIFKAGFLQEGKLDPTRYLIDEDELALIHDVLARHPEILVTAPQLHISGLLSNGKVSTIFLAAGRVPSAVSKINSHARGLVGRIQLFDGKPLEDDIIHGVGLSRGLAEQLKLDLGSDAVAMAPTVSGQVNALDAQVFQLFDSPVEALEDKLMSVSLKFAQSLYDTSSVDRVTVLLESDELTETTRTQLAEELAAQGLNLEVKTWNELSTFYTKVKQMFDVIFLFTFLIVFTIVVMSVINTVSMAIMERTREIGTLRALGVKRRGIVGLFAAESMLLGTLGSLLGMVLTVITWLGVALLKPTWIPPQITRRVPLEVYLVPDYMLYSVLLLIVLSLAAASLPARAAARMQIVGALGHT
ncbi:ABC transporter permease [Methylocaldum szegediense]|uniref:ABC transport system permease protein n=1 Tax=Methylocaldum szegediense TaxID=73780 RepID=A0ABM9I2J1_9GAMM|nr:FtsX-like permease family protein [Methylocaldum szegediense]CAI8849728.1 putative ABC transport system permease protein [Methylocaldum szegediense]